ncbi:hypothetical protein LX36DRAFT_238699 [Colletotrichum falcatum]|nr:hypothetical protein LX36DRAFT_238699 [Colletotrichum falcatum]
MLGLAILSHRDASVTMFLHVYQSRDLLYHALVLPHFYFFGFLDLPLLNLLLSNNSQKAY